MPLFGLRSMVKDGVRRLMRTGEPAAPAHTPPPPASSGGPAAASAFDGPPAAAAAPADAASPAPVVATPHAPPQPAPAVAPPPAPLAADAPPPEPAPTASAAPSAPDADADDSVGPPILFDEVQALLDDMVRPALQGDGGDITLIKVENRNIYVRLVGACSTCPSSIMTMKMGVESLLREEFPQMQELVQVDA